MRRLHRRALVAIALVFLSLLLAPTSASAHSVLVRTTPTDEVVPAAPPSVSLRFSEHPRGRFSVVHVTGPDGVRRDAGAVEVVDETVTQPVAGSRPAGVYTVDWRVVSADGHPISGEYRFTASAPAPDLAVPLAAQPQSAPAPAEESHGGGHGVHIVLGIGVAAVLLLSMVVERWWKRRKRTT